MYIQKYLVLHTFSSDFVIFGCAGSGLWKQADQSSMLKHEMAQLVTYG